MNTRMGFLKLGMPKNMIERLSREQILKVKFEIDTNPPGAFATETKFLYVPQAFSVRLFDLPSMFSGKLHAAIARGWKARVIGRDWFDLVWFVGKNVTASLPHLKARLVQTGHWNPKDSFTDSNAKELLIRRIQSLDIEGAKKDVRPFLAMPDNAQLDVWSKDFFLDLVSNVKFMRDT